MLPLTLYAFACPSLSTHEPAVSCVNPHTFDHCFIHTTLARAIDEIEREPKNARGAHGQ